LPNLIAARILLPLLRSVYSVHSVVRAEDFTAQKETKGTKNERTFVFFVGFCSSLSSCCCGFAALCHPWFQAVAVVPRIRRLKPAPSKKLSNHPPKSYNAAGQTNGADDETTIHSRALVTVMP
jgi:hypothetical protein